MGTRQSNGTWDYPHKDQPHIPDIQVHVMTNIGRSSEEVPLTRHHHASGEYLLWRRNHAAVQVTLKKSLPRAHID